MDALSEILELIKHKGIVYEKINFSAPWGIELPGDNNAQFWRLIKGNCLVTVPGQIPIEMKEGDTVLVPNGSAHWIADGAGSKRISSSEFLRERDSGNHLFSGVGDKTIMIGGHFAFDEKPGHPFLKGLPKVIHINNLESDVNSWLGMTCDLIFNELEHEQPGSRKLINGLADAVFIHIIRAYLKKNKNAGGFLSALKDERISSALQLMQTAPEKNWTIEQLSKHAGMSRSSFCIAFKKLVGETPLEYLTNWRIMKAKEILIQGNEKISEVALRVGYQSEAAFSRIFKAKVSQTPSVFKQENKAVR
ncbi:AraC family transcriptional regulator [Dyadobacter subterraneus]|uniref:AraC family transcriptional regulator n=1 Tax=Dyadobacter subterraneus TaxID=2773304 RepID=A0ABR9W7H2_9BACT|nr:AraC family transcriptional regulator [Dyadobacter subterraneus]MBE9461414.1 AraC family transcriptional regulator [Dyadobacter subterraneus]